MRGNKWSHTFDPVAYSVRQTGSSRARMVIRWELHAFIKVSFKVAAVLPVSHSHSFCPRPQSIFPSNYFPSCAAPCLTMMDHRLKRDVFSRCWIDSSTHIVPPSDQWTLERLCSPLLFPFHYDTVCLNFLLSGTLFCDVWLQHITKTKV